MKQNVGPGVIIAIVAVVLVAVGFFVFRTFFTDPNYTPLQGAKGEQEYSKQRSQQNQNMKAGRDVPFNGGR